MKAFITTKVGMTSTIAEDGTMTAITLLSASPVVVTQLKTDEVDGYTAVQLGAGVDKNAGKPAQGHFKKAGIMPKTVREFRVDTIQEDLAVGTQLTAEVFSVGDTVHVTGTSKGKGFAGGIKRHNFKRGRKTHGGRSYRRVGSIGSMYPQKIFKGKRMPGQYGAVQVTVQNLQVAIVDLEHNVIGVTGAVPGPRKGIVIVKGAK